MTSEPEPVLVDARGHRCPVPTLRLRRALEAAPRGSCVVLLADDPLARIDVPHLAASLGCEIERMDRDGRTLKFTVRRPLDDQAQGSAE